MSHGLTVWDADGTMSLQITDHLSRIIYSADVASNSTGSVTIDVPSSGKVIPVAMLHGDQASPYIAPHKVSISGSTLSWDLSSATTTGPSRIMVIAYG